MPFKTPTVGPSPAAATLLIHAEATSSPSVNKGAPRLPPELLIEVLQNTDFATRMTCRLVSRLVDTLPAPELGPKTTIGQHVRAHNLWQHAIQPEPLAPKPSAFAFERSTSPGLPGGHWKVSARGQASDASGSCRGFVHRDVFFFVDNKNESLHRMKCGGGCQPIVLPQQVQGPLRILDVLGLDKKELVLVAGPKGMHDSLWLIELCENTVSHVGSLRLPPNHIAAEAEFEPSGHRVVVCAKQHSSSTTSCVFTIEKIFAQYGVSATPTHMITDQIPTALTCLAASSASNSFWEQSTNTSWHPLNGALLTYHHEQGLRLSDLFSGHTLHLNIPNQLIVEKDDGEKKYQRWNLIGASGVAAQNTGPSEDFFPAHESRRSRSQADTHAAWQCRYAPGTPHHFTFSGDGTHLLVNVLRDDGQGWREHLVYKLPSNVDLQPHGSAQQMLEPKRGVGWATWAHRVLAKKTYNVCLDKVATLCDVGPKSAAPKVLSTYEDPDLSIGRMSDHGQDRRDDILLQEIDCANKDYARSFALPGWGHAQIHAYEAQSFYRLTYAKTVFLTTAKVSGRSDYENESQRYNLPRLREANADRDMNTIRLGHASDSVSVVGWLSDNLAGVSLLSTELDHGLKKEWRHLSHLTTVTPRP